MYSMVLGMGELWRWENIPFSGFEEEDGIG